MPLRHRHDHSLLIAIVVVHNQRTVLLDCQLRVVPELARLLLLLVLQLQFGTILHHAAHVRLRRLRQRLSPVLGICRGYVLRCGLDTII